MANLDFFTSVSMIETPIDSIPAIFQELRQSFNTGNSRPVAWRKQQIKQLFKMCEEQENVFAQAANADFHRPITETLLFDCGVVR